MHKRILLTGSSGGLGLIMAEFLLNEGHFVYLHYHANPSALESLCLTYPNQTKLLKKNLLIEEELTALFEETEGVNVLIHAAGVASAGMSWKVSKDEFRRVNGINYEAPFFVSQLMIPELRKQKWGRIIFFSSVVAQTGIAGTSVYSASKSALFGLTRTLAVELAPSGITVNCIAPGYMDEGMIREIPTEMRNEIINKTPIGSLADSKGILRMLDMLISEDSSAVTGQVFSINGGFQM